MSTRERLAQTLYEFVYGPGSWEDVDTTPGEDGALSVRDFYLADADETLAHLPHLAPYPERHDLHGDTEETCVFPATTEWGEPLPAGCQGDPDPAEHLGYSDPDGECRDCGRGTGEPTCGGCQ